MRPVCWLKITSSDSTPLRVSSKKDRGRGPNAPNPTKIMQLHFDLVVMCETTGSEKTGPD